MTINRARKNNAWKNCAIGSVLEHSHTERKTKKFTFKINELNTVLADPGWHRQTDVQPVQTSANAARFEGEWEKSLKVKSHLNMLGWYLQSKKSMP